MKEKEEEEVEWGREGEGRMVLLECNNSRGHPRRGGGSSSLSCSHKVEGVGGGLE